MKKAFTLVELIVVIAIIGILASVLLGNYSGILERARSTKCETNLRNLAQAVGSYAVCGHYPFAQSAQYIRTTGGTDNQGVEICEFKGWVSWLSQGTTFPIPGNSPASLTHCSYANNNKDQKLYAITNGAIWTAVGKNRSCYLCPVHVKACQAAGVNDPGWSYQMNAYFGYEEKKGAAMATEWSALETGSLNRADRVLLFAEIPALEPNCKAARKAGVKLPKVNLTGGDGTEGMDGCLKYKSLSGGGTGEIGFNHVRSRQIVGHVAFADGHVESLACPQNGDTANLTDWLCQGMDVAINGKNYRKINDSEQQ